MASLMIEHGLGVTTVETYDIKRIDTDYFIEEEVEYLIVIRITYNIVSSDKNLVVFLY